MEIKIVKQILEWNEDVSDKVKAELSLNNVCLVNVMGSPGAGKTSLITNIINRLNKKFNIGVIEGDIAGAVDAEKIGKMGIPVVQLQTDGACHIEAMSVKHILSYFNLSNIDVLFVENIGNLVCPAEFNIGEDFRIAILSVPEGDDKVVKYPLVFETTDALVINKIDALSVFDFSVEKVENDLRDLKGDAEIFCVSSKNGSGIDGFCSWLYEKIQNKINKTL